MSVHTNIHVDHKGDRWLIGVDTIHYKHLNEEGTSFTASNHGRGCDSPITESYRITSDELIELLQKHSTNDMLEETTSPDAAHGQR